MLHLLGSGQEGVQAPGRQQKLPGRVQRGRSTQKDMRLIQLNLNHCRAAQDLLKQTVRERGSEVAILSEPYRVPSCSDWATDRSGRATLWTCGVETPQSCDIKSADGFVRGKVGGKWVYSCYLAPSLPLETFSRIIDELIGDLRGRSDVVVGGDFNAWAQEWGSSLTNARGRTVLEAYLGHVIDLTYASSALARNSSWRISDAYTASDHEAIECVFVGPDRVRAAPTQQRKAYRKVTLRTQAFASALRTYTASESDGANEWATQLGEAVEAACDLSMLQRSAFGKHHAPVFWWNESSATPREDSSNEPGELRD
ncbi:uncharacterized protein LOC121405175 [Drosophila obscura]|uniref:uncharacterized protein LOC121405175 n=1 Tax=Drosophila obscura TaxID=7282 RepID=UPI001BB0DC0B|nr:uncharacterized protein LOC121405175 [Drosophila obscura]